MASFALVPSKALPPDSDKCLFPQEVLSEIIREHAQLPHPLVFKLTHADISIYVGVKEFTAPNGQIAVPTSVLGAISGPVVAELTNLPKATFLQLKPAQFYPHITNWKYYLESQLSKHYTTLSRKQTFRFLDDLTGNIVEMTVEDANEESVIVLDTDIDLDIVPLNDIMAAQQLRHSDNIAYLENIQAIPSNKVDLIPFNESAVPSIFTLNLRKLTLAFSITLQCDSDMLNVDLLVGLDKFVNLENFRWSTLTQGEDKKQIDLNPRSDVIANYMQKHAEDDSCFLYVVPFAWEHSASVSITVDQASLAKRQRTDDIPVDVLQCLNCRKDIEKSKLPLHEAFCSRNNVRCSCGQVFTKEIPHTHWHCDTCTPIVQGDTMLAKFKHNKLFHSPPYECEKCNDHLQFPNFVDLIQNHKADTCPSKLHECMFCHLVLPQEEATYEDNFSGLTHHESQCGNKTTECFQCGKVVKTRDLATHMRIHYLDKVELNTETVNKCTNSNCVNVFVNVGLSNDLGLCDSCFGPLYASVNDPNNMKLQSRIERKYMIQLTKGCGNSWCSNQECATGSRTALTVKELLQHIHRDLLPQISRPLLPFNATKELKTINSFHLCINESIQKRKHLIEQILSEGRYLEAMVYKAVGSQTGEEASRLWLSQHGL